MLNVRRGWIAQSRCRLGKGEPGPDADDVARGWGEDIRQVAQLVECLARARQGGEVGHELPLVRTSASWPAVAPRDARQYRTRLVAWAGCQEPQRYVREGWLTANAGAWAGAEKSATPHSTQCRATREYRCNTMQHGATRCNAAQHSVQGYSRVLGESQRSGLHAGRGSARCKAQNGRGSHLLPAPGHRRHHCHGEARCCCPAVWPLAPIDGGVASG